MARDHEEAASQLKGMIRQMGGTASDDSGAWGTLTKTVMGTAKLFGDKSALKALKEGDRDAFGWDKDGVCLLEGSTPLRDINKRLGLNFPLDGPKTLNGMMLELLQEIPDAPISLKTPNCIIEVIQVQNQSIKVVKLIRQSGPRTD